MRFVRTTVIGGLVFLVPLVTLIVVFKKAYDVMLDVAGPLSDIVPVESLGGVAIANLIAVVIVVLLCFTAGLIARVAIARRLTAKIESIILRRVPGYALVKIMASSLSPEHIQDMHPVLVSLGRTSRLGLETGRFADGRVAVYFPGSPNTWSGEVHIVEPGQTEKLDMPVSAVLEHAEQLGRGEAETPLEPRGAAPPDRGEG